MGKKPVLGIAGLLLAGVAICGCQRDRCCPSGPGPTQVSSGQGQGWGAEPAGRMTGGNAVAGTGGMSGTNSATGFQPLGGTPTNMGGRMTTTNMGSGTSFNGGSTGVQSQVPGSSYGGNQFHAPYGGTRPVTTGTGAPVMGDPSGGTRTALPAGDPTRTIGGTGSLSNIPASGLQAIPAGDVGGTQSRHQGLPAHMTPTPSVGGVPAVPVQGPIGDAPTLEPPPGQE